MTFGCGTLDRVSSRSDRLCCIITIRRREAGTHHDSGLGSGLSRPEEAQSGAVGVWTVVRLVSAVPVLPLPRLRPAARGCTSERYNFASPLSLHRPNTATSISMRVVRLELFYWPSSNDHVPAVPERDSYVSFEVLGGFNNVRSSLVLVSSSLRFDRCSYF